MMLADLLTLPKEGPGQDQAMMSPQEVAEYLSAQYETNAMSCVACRIAHAEKWMTIRDFEMQNPINKPHWEGAPVAQWAAVASTVLLILNLTGVAQDL